MNKVILSGKILEIKYKLVDKGKVCGIAFVMLKENENNVQLIFVNKLADKIFREYQTGNYILVEGKVMKAKENLVVRVKEVYKGY